ncbi:MAG: 50S ribosomal protein L19 [Acidobacteria bacterium]|nr:MAG: 50S ribosomal protein L19 [Acidobacteriota bacterium]
MQILHELEKELMKKEFPKFRAGDTVKVHLKIVEGNKERIQVFQGVVIAINKKMNRGTFVVRKVSAGNYGVERIIPFYSPAVDKIEVVKYGRVRRAKLYYLRGRSGKAARIPERRIR